MDKKEKTEKIIKLLNKKNTLSQIDIAKQVGSFPQAVSRIYNREVLKGNITDRTGTAKIRSENPGQARLERAARKDEEEKEAFNSKIDDLLEKLRRTMIEIQNVKGQTAGSWEEKFDARIIKSRVIDNDMPNFLMYIANAFQLITIATKLAKQSLVEINKWKAKKWSHRAKRKKREEYKNDVSDYLSAFDEHYKALRKVVRRFDKQRAACERKTG